MILVLRALKTSKKLTDRIKTPVKKLHHLFSLYSDHKFYKNHEPFLLGLIDMVAGLEYHFKQHSKYEEKAKRGLSYSSASHEAVAYLNRLGQIYFFFNAAWLHDFFCGIKKQDSHSTQECGLYQKLDGELCTKIPAIFALIPIRNKFTAHRQQDKPWSDDCASLGLNVAGLMPGFGGKIPETINVEELARGEPEIFCKTIFDTSKPNSRIHYSYPTNQRLLSDDHELVSGIEFFGNNMVIVFSPTEQHKKIVEEILDFVELLLQTK